MLTLDWEVLEIMRYVDVITTANNTITYPELLYMFRGRRLDDKITEAILDRLRLLLQLQENAVLNKHYDCGIYVTFMYGLFYRKVTYCMLRPPMIRRR
ncbi:uncharacterized protein LOC109824235 isoform X3 [Asparagus officinalis]|uniref:uncharacterized protein LOC109824235 isoform X3 n=1 Tax=Asparagus officinalis TaxID=4686 RepID=UPI00098DE21E|nr:uncharacterized protein LOC109824235 isoform X3 [Asparagus officinalis]